MECVAPSGLDILRVYQIRCLLASELPSFFDFAPLAPLRGEGLGVRGLICVLIGILNAVGTCCIVEKN